jgi:hypothetical protein
MEADEAAERADIEQPQCPACGQPGYRIVETRTPLGFRAGLGRDFDGMFSWSPRRVVARAAARLDLLPQTREGAGLVARAGRGDRYIVNDNVGRLFAFHRTREDWGGYVERTIADRAGDPRLPVPNGEGVAVALGVVRPTDMLFLGADNPTTGTGGLRLNLRPGSASPLVRDVSDGLRAAWHSLAFLLRSAAATHLDIQPQEIIAGIHSAAWNGEQNFHAFLADTLENGAGFSSHLGEEKELGPFLDAVEQYLEGLRREDHERECVSSCYRCLRDFTNMAYHPLLDWRVASDLLHVLREGTFGEPDEARERRALDGLLDGAQYPRVPAPGLAVLVPNARAAIVLKHPLEALDSQVASPRLAETVQAVLERGVEPGRIIVADVHTAETSPMVIKQAVRAGGRGRP